jgi:type I restriction enzyme S subunit
MLDGLKPYSKYKDEPWPGAVPAHWELRRAKYVLREIDNRWPEKTGTLLSVSQYTGVTKRRLRDGSDEPATRSETLEGYKVVAANDLAVNIMLAWNGSLGVAPFDGVVSPAYCVYRFRDGNPWYFHSLLRSPEYRAEIKRRSRGVVESRLRLYSDDLFRMPLLVPPPDEQAGIVRFLGAVDRKVNRFIRAKRRLIEVLTEQKQAIITHAVTKGLNPAAPKKPSGIDWLGDVPEHWEVRKLRTLFRRHGSGTTPPGDAYYGGGVPWVMTGDLNDKVLTATQRTVTPKALEEVKALRMYPAGSLLVAMYGATIGKTGVLSMDACTNQACCVLAEPRPESNVRFLQAFVIMARPQLVQQSYGGGQPNINSEIVRALRIPLPPRTEQDAILDAIAQRTGTIDTAIDRASREIDLIREYRTRLVADVVTGKVDVRAAAAAIPDEDADPGPDPGAGEPGDVADPGDADADGGADIELALGAAGTEGAGGEDEA